jgi:RimJ/RimL family protein N-acetyltransferase
VVPDIALVPLWPDDAGLRAAVVLLAPTGEQEVFASRAARTLPEADADPQRTPFAVVDAGRPVGFGVLDRRGYLDDLVDTPGRAVLLRGFYLDAAEQGAGRGTAAAALVPTLAAQVYDDVELVVLTVNVRNPGAIRAYTRAGFVDTGTRYLGGGAGPQHLLVARVPR